MHFPAAMSNFGSSQDQTLLGSQGNLELDDLTAAWQRPRAAAEDDVLAALLPAFASAVEESGKEAAGLTIVAAATFAIKV